MIGKLYLEDGTVYEGKGFGSLGTSSGELVFNTSMTGYQEILTDPSYAGQVITMTYPLIGNYGTNAGFNESSKVYAHGLVVKSISETPSNCMNEQSINDMLCSMGIVGVYGVDTRSITRKVRDGGVIKCVITNQELSEDEIKNYFNLIKKEDDWMKEVSTKEAYKMQGKGHKVALIDFGVKANIIRNLVERDCDITVFPYNASFEEIMSIDPHGVFLSNGPGDPKCAVDSVNTAKKLIGKVPMFGICMGHQILGLACGGETYKLKYGHRGGNHGVKDLDKDKCYITSQNHGYAVDAESIKKSGMVVTHLNLNDGTVEGMRHKELPIFSVQFHPEGAPGPGDSEYLFDKFIDLMDKE